MNNSGTKRLQLLLIEDDFDHAELTKRIIYSVSQDVKVIHVKNGEKALGYLLNCTYSREKTPDLIILDLRLPGVDGIEVLKEIKSWPEYKKIPVVILSTSGFNHDREMARKYKTDKYIVKPLTPESFNSLLKEFNFI